MKKSADFKRITHSGSTQVDARDAFHMLQMLERSLQDIETRMSRAVGDIEKQLTGLNRFSYTADGQAPGISRVAASSVTKIFTPSLRPRTSI